MRLQDVGQADQTHRTLRLWWVADNAPTQPLGVSERTVTEWAAYGGACANEAEAIERAWRTLVTADTR